MSIENPTLAHFSHFRHFSSLYCPLHLSRILYKSPLFLQNKPNLLVAQMNVNPYNKTDYENFTPLAGQKNKPNSNPIKPNFQKAQINVNLTLTKDYRKKDDFIVRINKPNFQNAKKWTQTLFHKRITRIKPPSGPKKQTQNKPNSNPISKAKKCCCVWRWLVIISLCSPCSLWLRLFIQQVWLHSLQPFGQLFAQDRFS